MRRCWSNFALHVHAARWAVGVTLALVGAPAVHAQIIPDTVYERPTISEARNGVPVIAINKPSGAGISYNAFKTFGVGENGVVLNNSLRPVGTDLAYNVSRNRKFENQVARIIIADVKEAASSVLSGIVEVAGGRADLVISNPHGITCSGCGFIGTDRVVLTTGAPAFQNGLEAFYVSRGEINIERLVAPDLVELDLIGRKVSIKGELRAKDVDVISGANEVRYLPKHKRNDGGEDILPYHRLGLSPERGIDVAALGGIHAGKMRLLSTETGTGVRVAGKLESTAGDLEITSAGKLSVEAALSSSGALIIRADRASVVAPLAPARGRAGAGGIHVLGDGVGVGESPLAGGGRGGITRAGGSPGAVDGVGAGGPLGVVGSAEAGKPPVVVGSAEASKPPVAAGSADAGKPPVVVGSADAGKPPVVVGSADTGKLPVVVGGAGAGGPPVGGGGTEAGKPPVAGAGAVEGTLPVAGGGAETARPPVAGGGVHAGIAPRGASEAPHLAAEPGIEVIRIAPSRAMPSERIQTDHPTTSIRDFAPVRWLPMALGQYLMQSQEIIPQAAAQTQPAALFTLPQTAPGPTIARVDESFDEQRTASERLRPEKRRRSFDIRDFEQGHGVFSMSAANDAKPFVSAVAPDWPS
jgi:filamentous hemagglutinin family protein